MGFSTDGERCFGYRNSSSIHSSETRRHTNMLETVTGKEITQLPQNADYIERTPGAPFFLWSSLYHDNHLMRSDTGEEIWTGGDMPFITPDGRYYSVITDNRVNVYRMGSQEVILTLRNSIFGFFRPSFQGARSFACTSDAKQIGLEQSDGSLAVWDMDLPIEQPLMSGSYITPQILSEDGKYLLSHTWNEVMGEEWQRRDARTGQAMLAPRADALGTSPLSSPDGRWAIVYQQKRDTPGCFFAVVFDTTTIKTRCRIEVDERWRSKVQGSPNFAGPVPLWKGGGAICAACTADGTQYLLAGRDNAIERFDLQTGRQLPSLHTPVLPLALFCSPDNTTLMVMGDEKNHDGTLLALDMRTGSVRFRRRYPAKTVLAGVTQIVLNPLAGASLQFSRDGRFACVSTVSSPPVSTLLLDLRTDKEVLSIPDCHGVQFFADNQRVAVADGIGRIRIWNVATWKALKEMEDRTGRQIIRLAVTQDGKRLFTSNAQETQIWNVETGEILQVLSGVHKVQTFPDGSVLLTGEMIPGTHKYGNTEDVWWMRAPHAVETAAAQRVESPVWYSRQGRNAAETGEWQHAQDAFKTAIHQQSGDVNDYVGLALTQLLLGQNASYRQTCERIAAQWGSKLTPQCCLAANGLQDYGALFAEVQEILQYNPQNTAAKLNLGYLQFREGKWQECVNTLTPLLAPDVATTNPDVQDWVFAAMACWHLGNKEEARRYLKSGEECLAKKQPPLSWQARVSYGKLWY